MKHVVLSILAAAALASAAAADPAADPKIRTLDYSPDRVPALQGRTGYQMMLEFAPDERIENVSIGDAAAWQVTPNRKADLLFLKPLTASASTNLTVVTNQRRYAFDLVVEAPRKRAEVPYIVRFRYPAAAPASLPPASDAPAPASWNLAYELSGAPALRPARVFDDGRHTYFEWPQDAALPAIYSVDAAGRESLVNQTVQGRYVVVADIAPQFTLRSGTQWALVRNTSYPAAPVKLVEGGRP
jgi:type IV secretion system protein VirB9